ncbi:hypothetical protein QJS66_08050 [Kocuria rhizophila]|nr:hypothetical protein QJS66_08050 [Kocuria rhizophila]
MAAADPSDFEGLGCAAQKSQLQEQSTSSSCGGCDSARRSSSPAARRDRHPGRSLSVGQAKGINAAAHRDRPPASSSVRAASSSASRGPDVQVSSDDPEVLTEGERLPPLRRSRSPGATGRSSVHVVPPGDHVRAVARRQNPAERASRASSDSIRRSSSRARRQCTAAFLVVQARDPRIRHVRIVLAVSGSPHRSCLGDVVRAWRTRQSPAAMGPRSPWCRRRRARGPRWFTSAITVESSGVVSDPVDQHRRGGRLRA